MQIAIADEVIESLVDADSILSDIPDDRLRGASGILVKLSLDLWLQSFNMPAASDIAKALQQVSTSRLKDRRIFVTPEPSQLARLAFSQALQVPREPRVLTTTGDDEATFADATQEEIGFLCRAELAEIFSRSKERCLLQGSAQHHFALPSGAHVSQFVRLADLFCRVNTLDAVAYWISQKLGLNRDVPTCENHVVVVDNSSLIGLLARLQTISRKGMHIECLPSYPTTSFERDANDKFLDNLAKNANRLDVIISVASTGGMLSHIAEWREESAVLGDTLVLYSTVENNWPEVLCNVELSGYEHFGPTEECKLCADTKAVEINPETYFYSAQPGQSVALTKNFFERQADFISRYGGEPGVLKVHVDDPNESGKRHHAFYVDVAALLKVSEFVEQLKNYFESFADRPDLIVGPKHYAAGKIGAIAASSLGVQFFPHNSLRLDADSADDAELIALLSKATSILVIDDLYIEGKRFKNYNRAMREQGNIFGSLESVTYFNVGTIVESEAVLAKQERGLTSNHVWKACRISMFSLNLPRWLSREKCPWCMEQTHLLRLARKQDELDSPFEERLNTLFGVEHGLRENWCHVDGTIPSLGGQNALKLAAGASPLQVLFACASAVQQLRHVPEGSLDIHAFPAPRLLAKRVFSDNYTETLIWVCLLRTLIAAETEVDLKFYLLAASDQIGSDPSTRYATLELAVAAARGHLGPKCKKLEEFLRGVSFH